MEKNYYPLRQGSNSDTIVSDVPTRTYQNKEEVKADINHYGGHLVCESCPPSIAKQLIEAYNEKHGCTDKKNPCTGGRMCCQSKISHHTWMEQEYKLNSAHSFTEGAYFGREDDPSIDDQIKFMNDILKLSRVNYTRIDGRIQASGQKPEDIPYSKHEKIYKSIINNLQAIQRFNNSPALHDVDVEKVVRDLVDLIKHLGKKLLWPDAWVDKSEQIQNAEAALGMLQAFKKQRVVTPIDVADAYHAGKNIFDPATFDKPDFDSPDFHAGMNFRKQEDDEKIKDLIAFTEYKLGTKIVWNEQQHIWQQVLPEQRVDITELRSLRDEMVNRMSDVHGRYHIADAVLFVIEELLKHEKI